MGTVRLSLMDMSCVMGPITGTKMAGLHFWEKYIYWGKSMKYVYQAATVTGLNPDILSIRKVGIHFKNGIFSLLFC